MIIDKIDIKDLIPSWEVILEPKENIKKTEELVSKEFGAWFMEKFLLGIEIRKYKEPKEVALIIKLDLQQTNILDSGIDLSVFHGIRQIAKNLAPKIPILYWREEKSFTADVIKFCYSTNSGLYNLLYTYEISDEDKKRNYFTWIEINEIFGDFHHKGRQFFGEEKYLKMRDFIINETEEICQRK